MQLRSKSPRLVLPDFKFEQLIITVELVDLINLSVNLIENDFSSLLISATKRCVEFVPMSIEATKICFS